MLQHAKSLLEDVLVVV